MKCLARWLWLLLPAVALAAFLTGCSRYVDVWVVNPCAQPVRVETSDSSPEHFGRYPPSRSVTVEPLTISKVDDAFTNQFEGTIRLVGYESLIPVDDDRWPHDTVLLPVDSCASAWTPAAVAAPSE